MKYHKNVPMKSSVPKKFRWILTRNMTLEQVLGLGAETPTRAGHDARQETN